MSSEFEDYEDTVCASTEAIDKNFSLYLCNILQSRISYIKRHIEENTLGSIDVEQEFYTADEYYSSFKESISKTK